MSQIAMQHESGLLQQMDQSHFSQPNAISHGYASDMSAIRNNNALPAPPGQVFDPASGSSQNDESIRKLSSTTRPSSSSSAGSVKNIALENSTIDARVLKPTPKPEPRNGQHDSKPRLSKSQQQELEAHFQQQQKPSTVMKQGFANDLAVSLEKVNNWFQNRRAKVKQDAKKRLNNGEVGHNDLSSLHPSTSSQFVDESFYDTHIHFTSDEPDSRFMSQQPRSLTSGQLPWTPPEASTSSFASSPHHFQMTADPHYNGGQEIDNHNRPRLDFYHESNEHPQQFSGLRWNWDWVKFQAGRTSHLDGFTGPIPNTDITNSAASLLTQNSHPDMTDFSNSSMAPEIGKADEHLVVGPIQSPNATDIHPGWKPSPESFGAVSNSPNDVQSRSELLHSLPRAALQQPRESINEIVQAPNPFVYGPSIPVDHQTGLLIRPNTMHFPDNALGLTHGPISAHALFAQKQHQQLDQLDESSNNSSIPEASESAAIPPQGIAQPTSPPTDVTATESSSPNALPVRKQSAMSNLADTLNAVVVQPPPQSPTCQTLIAEPGLKQSNLAARRQARRPAALGTASMRSTSYHIAGPRSPNNVNQNLAPEQTLRRIKSSISASRIQKAGTCSAQRSPLALTFEESARSPRQLRTSSVANSIQNGTISSPIGPTEDQGRGVESGPMTPLSPRESMASPTHLPGKQEVSGPRISGLDGLPPNHEEQSGVFTSLNWGAIQHDFENSQPYDLSSVPPTSATGVSFVSPPSTPLDGAPLINHNYYNDLRLASRAIPVPHSAPAWQQTFPSSLHTPVLHRTEESGAGTPIPRSQNMMQAPQQLPHLRYAEMDRNQELQTVDLSHPQRQRTFTDTAVSPSCTPQMGADGQHLEINNVAHHLDLEHRQFLNISQVHSEDQQFPSAHQQSAQTPSMGQTFHFVHNTALGGTPLLDWSDPVPAGHTLTHQPGSDSHPTGSKPGQIQELTIHEYLPNEFADSQGAVRPLSKSRHSPLHLKEYIFTNTGPESYANSMSVPVDTKIDEQT